jgi:hypothetical protein
MVTPIAYVAFSIQIGIIIQVELLERSDLDKEKGLQ